jgi:hypothetical protein
MVKKIAATIALIAAVAALQGCAYDPYTGTYVPCCAYPAYPAYGYYGPPVVGGVVIRGGWHRW